MNDTHLKLPSSLTSSSILILGGSGFIGSHLSRLLIQRGVPVVIGDLQPSKDFPGLWKQCDVCDEKTLRTAMQRVGCIINLAAEHRDNVRPLSRYRQTNVEGAHQICLAARKAQVQRIIFTSSVAVYGFQPIPVDENGPFSPSNAYGKTKLEAEAVYRAWADEDPSRTLVIVRPTVVFGERNRGNVYNLMKQIVSGRFFMVGSGSNKKSIAYVGNITAFLTHTLLMGPGTHIFNYVDGPDMTSKELVEHIKACLGYENKTPAIPMPVALAGGFALDLLTRVTGRTFSISFIRIRKFCASTQFRANRVAQLDFVPPYSLRDGMARTIRFEFVEDHEAHDDSTRQATPTPDQEHAAT